MLLSRFWYIFLAVAAAVGVGAGLLGQGVVNQQQDDSLAEALRRDRFAMEAVMRLEARNRLDRIAFITVDPKFGALLRKSGGIADRSKMGSVGREVKGLLRTQARRLVEAGDAQHKKRLMPDIAFAVDRLGRIVAQLGPMEANPPGSSLVSYPLVRRALQGYLRDDVWIYDRKVYRMAARPVVSGSSYAGAILHGYAMNQLFAEQLSQNLGGASVAFFHGTRILGGYEAQGGPTLAALAAPLETALADEDLRAGKRTQPIDLGDSFRATYSLTAGSAAASQVGYVVGRPRQKIDSPIELFSTASQQDLDRLPTLQLAIGALVAALLGFFFVWWERLRPFSRLLKQTTRVAEGSEEVVVTTAFRGGFRNLAEQINKAMNRTAEETRGAAPTKPRANLDDLLGPTPETPSEPFFGFAEEAPATPGQPLPPAAPAAAASATQPLPPAQLPTPGGDRPTPRFDEDAHFRQVFDQYIATRRQCGESTDSLNFDKFSGTLTRTRDQLMAQHGAQAVRFTVYIKQGKAALKASPVQG